MMFVPDMPGAIVYPAHETNIMRGPNNPKILCLHTPEEPADDYESTPVYFSQPNRGGSTHYYQDNDGDLYQLVQESRPAIANGVTPGKFYPTSTNPRISLNRQSLSVEIEGYAASMHRTCRRYGRQWNAVVRWVVSRCRAHNIAITRANIIGHYEVASNRSDPGTLNINLIVQDAQALAEEAEDDMANVQELERKIVAQQGQIDAILNGVVNLKDRADLLTGWQAVHQDAAPVKNSGTPGNIKGSHFPIDHNHDAVYVAK